MFKVECEGCQAPYDVDERRVPSAGLKMRCPKCGVSFLVHKPGADGGAELPAVAPTVPPKAVEDSPTRLPSPPGQRRPAARWRIFQPLPTFSRPARRGCPSAATAVRLTPGFKSPVDDAGVDLRRSARGSQPGQARGPAGSCKLRPDLPSPSALPSEALTRSVCPPSSATRASSNFVG